MWREPAPDAGGDRQTAKLLSRGRARPRPPAGRAVDNAEERPDRHSTAMLEPRAKLIPAPVVHAGLPSLTALSPANEYGAALGIEIRFGQVQRLADSKPGAPEHDD